MKRSNSMGIQSHDNLASFKQKVAYHEAGHATGIHFNCTRRNLPPVFFQIIFKHLEEKPIDSQLTDQINPYDCIAKVKGGRLIQTLPMPLKSWHPHAFISIKQKPRPYTDDYRLALEADVVNLLVGPLAEAKYIALMDNEPFHQQLLAIPALKNYGGDDDLAAVYDYLQSYSADKQEQDVTLNQLFIKAFNFVNDDVNWSAITHLANFILTSNKNRISCEEVATILEDK
ncbi:MAG: hypothetical protein ABL903_05850 [Methylococcales bacterium]